MYQIWKSHNYSAEWCNQHFVHVKSLRKVREVREQLKEIMQTQKIPLISCEQNFDLIRKAICSGYFINSAKIKGIGDYVNLRTGLPCKLHPSSALYSLGYAPDYIVYHELIMTSKEYMHCVTAVDAHWLAELGPMFFSVRQPVGERRLRHEREKAEKEKLQKCLTELEQQSIKNTIVDPDFSSLVGLPSRPTTVHIGSRMASSKISYKRD